MNKNLIIGAILVLILAAGGYYLYSNNSKVSTGMTQDTPEVPQGPTDEQLTNGRYMVYDEGHFIQSAEDSRRVLFFYASWCPTCRPADAEFEANKDKLPEDLVLYRVNYDTEDTLKEKYGITYQHTFVQVDSEGNEIAKWNGGSLNELLSNIK